MKTNELTGAALDWAVAKCEKFKLAPVDSGDTCVYYDDDQDNLQAYSPSKDWARGGPIIEREGISVREYLKGFWAADIQNGAHERENPTPLIAAMQCYVASKLGDEIEIPEELA